MNGADFIKTLFVDYLGPTILYGGGVWIVLAAMFKAWQEWKHSDPPNWAKVAVSITVPYIIVLAVYWAGVWVDAWAYDKTALLNILGNVTMGIVGSKGWFAATEFGKDMHAAGSGSTPETLPPPPPSANVTTGV